MINEALSSQSIRARKEVRLFGRHYVVKMSPVVGSHLECSLLRSLNREVSVRRDHSVPWYISQKKRSIAEQTKKGDINAV